MTNDPMTNDSMTNDQIPGEFSIYCQRYYELTKLLAKRYERFTTLVENTPEYCGQTNVSAIDAIISYYRKMETAKAKWEKTTADLLAAERLILKIMQHFEIRPGTMLTGEIPGEVEYGIWANGNDEVYIIKTKNLQPEEDNPNVIVIKFWNKDEGKEED
jgi:hypothetical protein